MIPPTPRQRELLRFIAGFLEVHGKSPTMAEMADGIGVRMKSTSFRLLVALEERGALRRTRSASRKVELLTEVPLPRAPDGAPLYAVPFKVAPFGEARR